MPKKPVNKNVSERGLIITRDSEGKLSSAQSEFNRVMQKLEAERAKHQRKQARLDNLLVVVIRDVMPLLEDVNRTNRDLVFHVVDAMGEFKLTKKRISYLKDVVGEITSDLLSDPCGISEEDVGRLEKIVEELQPSGEQTALDAASAEEFDFLRSMIEGVAENAGLDLDLSDLDPNMNPADFERLMRERFRAAAEAKNFQTQNRPRKQTKAQLEKARKIADQEEAKKRDIKSLYKQLAKALHPDLETDVALKQHKEIWMKRLTSAYADGNLRELLQIEMEWLGEEAGNLSNAGDEKLKIYCAVLKEQITDLRNQTNGMTGQPQYSPIHRFIHPFFGDIPKPEEIKSGLKVELQRHRKMLEIFKKCQPNRKKLMEKLADDHERNLRANPIPF